MTEHLPGRGWELRGPVAVWTPGGIWPSWDSSLHHRREPLVAEVGARAAAVLGQVGPDRFVIDGSVWERVVVPDPVPGQMRLL